MYHVLSLKELRNMHGRVTSRFEFVQFVDDVVSPDSKEGLLEIEND